MTLALPRVFCLYRNYVDLEKFDVMLPRPTMGYRFIHRQAKIAAIRLYERDLLDLEDILDICGFSRRTWFRIQKLWNQTGDVVRKPTQHKG